MKHLKGDTVNEVIAMAKRCYLQDDQGNQTENYSEIEKLENYIDKLSNDEKTELLALMWLGRDKEVKDWDDMLSYAKNETDDAGIYIAEKLSLAHYLTKGLEKLSKSPC